jgi:Zn-finger nucleic acid-binding protein
MEAGALNCPHCGAAVTSDSPQCPFCKSLLQTVACPRCMGMMFLGTKFCPHCGAAADSPTPGIRTEQSCPRCQTGLVTVEFGRFVIQQCDTCGGLWMSVGVFDRVCSDAEAQSAAAALSLPPAPREVRKVAYILCPACGQQMGRINFAHRSGVIIDICRQHGVWLDRDELQQILDFIHAGGLTRARLLEKEQLDASRRALEFQKRTEHDPFNLRGTDELREDPSF